MTRAERLAPYLAEMAASEQVIKQQSTTFYYAFSQLPAYQAKSIFVLYDFLRQLDDAADTKQTEAFTRLRQLWQTVKLGTPQTRLGRNLLLVFQTFAIPMQLMDEMIQGQTHDLQHQPIRTWADLHHYCYLVAGTVGLMIMPILREHSLTTTERAHVIRVGIALQLTNILRDVQEDYRKDYVYLPQAVLFQAGIDLKCLNHTQRKLPTGLVHILKLLGKQAEHDYRVAPAVINLVPDSAGRVALALAINGYAAILKQLRRRNYNVSLGRVVVSNRVKAWLLVRAKLRYAI
ncbi:squalene/phytoene synthase family protein [Fructilactobacillus myrtifloralis]|uniref:Squalene/phytoene synthase family protein n=1 Tax=Fructilactobacillus myrtifloralis TaxID=2940301 RepID=A0ABY5BLS5_9LACO|nr:phytoene/squalene synthase family protein [Fructilactobacillus myrtifloralis]USS84572.1 squalene/phytoene synthase family protein [Fructilactobacillus myrtifloralis]